MEPYAYRENLESILNFTGGRHMISIAEATEYLGFRDPRTVQSRCPYFVDGKVTAETFAKALCDYDRTRRKRK